MPKELAASSQNSKHSFFRDFLASTIAGTTTFAALVPLETGVTRLQVYDGLLRKGKGWNFSLIYEVVTKNPYTKLPHVPYHLTTLWNGTKVGIVYKGLQAGLRYSLQPYVDSAFKKNDTIRGAFQDTFGKNLGDVMRNGIAGSFVGITEAVVVLPLDRLKKQMMVKNGTIPSLSKTFRAAAAQPLTSHWNGLGPALARNSLGSFSQFGADTAIKVYLFGLENPKQANHSQMLISSMMATFLMIYGTSPFDVWKSRAQTRDTGKILKEAIRHSGYSVFFRGALTKAVTKTPSSALTFYFAQFLMTLFDEQESETLATTASHRIKP